MAALEYRVISEILRSKNFQAVIKLGLKKDHFKDLEAREIFEFIWNHYYSRDTPRQVALIESVKKRWHSFEMTATEGDEGSLLSLIKELKFAALSTDMESLAREFAELVAENPEDALKIMRNQLASITQSFESKSGFGVREIVDGVRQQYEGARAGTVFGIPWPWEVLTADTMGKNKGDLIVLYGRMKSMKTWVLLKCAVDDYLINKQRVLLWSREMGPEKLKLRLGSIMAKVDYQCLKKGDLPKPLFKRAMRTLEGLSVLMDRSPEELVAGANRGTEDIIVLAGRDAPRTLSEFRAAIDMYQPDIVYVDSFYHMESDRVKANMQHWNKILLLAEDLKEAALDFEIPFVIAGQANKEGEKMTGESLVDMAGADAISREADLVIRIIRKRGNELWEDDYEAYWEAEEKGLVRATDRMAARAGLRIQIPTQPKQVAKPKLMPALQIPTKKSAIPEKALSNGKMQPKSLRRPRICAELALMPSGNREGTLEGFIIRATPGYDMDTVLRDNVSPDDVKEWIREGRKLKAKSGKKRGSNEPESYAGTASGLKTGEAEG